MIHLDTGTGEVQVRLPVRPVLKAAIPTCKDYANLGGNANEELLRLVKRWRELGWVEKVVGSALNGDCLVIAQDKLIYELGRIDVEWRVLQFRLVKALEYG